MRVVTMLFHDVYRESASASGFAGPAADRYKLTVREFDEQLMGMARARSAAPMLVRELPSEPDGLVPFAITVDDGGVSYYTTVAERLEALGWRGHCFVTTGRIGQAGFLDKYQIRDLNQRAHVIGSHSVSGASAKRSPWRKKAACRARPRSMPSSRASQRRRCWATAGRSFWTATCPKCRSPT